MKNNFMQGTLWVFLLFAVPVRAEQGGVAQGYPELARILDQVSARYPSITLYDAKSDALSEKKTQVSSWEAPMLALGVSNVPTDNYSLSKEAMTQKTISVSQKIYAPGKLDKRGEVVEKQKAEIQSGRNAELTAVASDIKLGYFGLSSLLLQKEMVEESKRLIENLISVARKKYEVGRGNQTDILEAEVERSKLMEQIITIEKEVEIQQHRINRYLEKGEKFDPQIQRKLFYSKLEDADETLLQTAFARNPNLQMTSNGIETVRTQRELAKMNSNPDYDLMLEYGQRDSYQGENRPEMVGMKLTFDLPFIQQGKRQAEVREIEFEEIALAKQREDQLNRIESELKSRISSIRKNEELIQLYANGIIPQKNQSLMTAFSNYQTDRIDFLFLLNIEIGLLNDKIRLVDSIFNHEMAVAELEELTGAPVSTKPQFVMEVKP